MIRCKKHKKVLSLHNHNRMEAGACENCAYFSSKNCGSHGKGQGGGNHNGAA